MTAIPLSALATSRRWQDNFVSLVPAIQTHANICFRRRNPVDREEAAAEATAAACLSYRSLARQRRLGWAYVGTLADFAVRRVAQGRHVGGHQSSRDVLSPLTAKKKGVVVTTLSPWDASENTWRDVMVESKRVSPADHAAFNLDFATWLKQWSPRQRRVINALAAGHRAVVVAEKFGVSQGRVSQWRRRYQRSWEIFQGENAPVVA